MTWNAYQLIDFGSGRKLERFAQTVLDRPSPPAESMEILQPSFWNSAEGRFVRSATAHNPNEPGRWQPAAIARRSWILPCGDFQLELKCTPFGHLGVFPEQYPNWLWIGRQVKRANRPLRVLNLFGYTGGSTLAAAAAGAEEVVHVDAAANIVQWGKRNAELSGLQHCHIRWITEDAVKFVTRELRRGRQYDAIILDPPAFGRGPKNERWQISQHLMPLLRQCAKLVHDRLCFFLLTCHSSGFQAPELHACLQDSLFGHCQQSVSVKPMDLIDQTGRRLSTGFVGKWP